MTTEYLSFPGRVMSAITEPRYGRVRVSIDIDPLDRRAREELDRCVIDGAIVDVVVSRAFRTVGQVKEAERNGTE